MDAFELLIKASESSAYAPVPTNPQHAAGQELQLPVDYTNHAEVNRRRAEISSNLDPIDSIMLLAEVSSMKSPIKRKGINDDLAIAAPTADHNFGPYFHSPQGLHFRRPRAMSEPWAKMGAWDESDLDNSPHVAAERFNEQHDDGQHLFRSSSFHVHGEFDAAGESTLPQMLDQYAAIYNKNGRIGIYTKDERATIIERFREKRKRRVWKKKIRYNCRKNLADRRIRVKGRFVKAGSKLALELAAAAAAAGAGSDSGSKNSPSGNEEEDDDDEYDMEEDDDNNDMSAAADDNMLRTSLTKRSQPEAEVKEYVVSNRSGSDTTNETSDFTPRNTNELLQQHARVVDGIAAMDSSVTDEVVKTAAAAVAASLESSGQDDVLHLPSGKRMRRHSIAY